MRHIFTDVLDVGLHIHIEDSQLAAAEEVKVIVHFYIFDLSPVMLRATQVESVDASIAKITSDLVEPLPILNSNETGC